MASQTQREPAKISIGALSKATDIPVETLRTWERRYGFPNPERNDAGHRKYAQETVGRLRLINEALESGHRASNVVGLSRDELLELLNIAGQPDNPKTANDDISVRDPSHEDVRKWLVAVREFDGAGLEHHFRTAWMQMGALGFLTERVQPFLFEIGTAWAERRLTVSHEHFASERLRDFLTTHWRPLAERATGDTVVLATLPGESHSLGLQMAAVVLAVAGCKLVYLGSDAPPRDVADVAADQGATAVIVSISVAANRFMARRDLAELRDRLEARTKLIVGGLGAPEGLPGITRFTGLEDLADWAAGVGS